MRERVIQYDLDQCDSQLIDTAADSCIKRAQVIPGLQSKTGPGQFHSAEMPQIPQGKKEREKLTQNGGQRCAEYAPIQYKNENGVQNGIYNGSGHHAEHGIFWAAVCPDQVADTVGQNKEWHTDQYDL